MNQYYGMTAEMYQSVKALVDERVSTILSRHNYDRLAEGQERLGGRMDRVEAALERLTEAQARTEKRVDQLAQAQTRTEERLDQLTQRVDQLAQAQTRTEERLDQLTQRVDQLTQRVDQLAQAQTRTEERLDQLAQAQTRTEERLDQLTQAQARTEEKLGDLIEVVSNMRDTQGALRGEVLELTYRRRVGTYFGPLLRRVRVVSPIEIEDDLEAHLSGDEFRDLLRVDLVVSGYPRHLADVPRVWIAVEISGVVDRHDVERAQRRASLLSKAAYPALPAVAGENITEGARTMAEEERVLLVLNGYTALWDQALKQALEMT
jgi:vacuolar-type H+-ATPase subunit I/STV1